MCPKAALSKFLEKFFKLVRIIPREFSQEKTIKSSLFKELKEKDAVYLKTPGFIPKEALNSLSNLFEKYSSILLAYLAEGFLEAGEVPHYIVGIKLDPKAGIKIEQLMEMMAKDLHEVIPKGFYVDFIELDERRTSINDFMKDYLIPFYSK
jgi:hypothetical protein